MKLHIILLATSFAVAASQKNQYTTPVPILKQINKHNEDGSYSYGYEAADGTFKIETKYPDGEVYGKYGYVDDTGKLREVEYGASKRGFEPNGNDIQVPPPTLKQNPSASRPLGPNEVDDGQYREDPSVYYQNEEGLRGRNQYQQPQSIYRPEPRPQPAYRPEPQPQPQFRPQPQSQFDFNFNWDQPKQTPQYQPQYQQPRPQYYQPPAPQPTYRPQSYYNPQPQPTWSQQNWAHQFQGHPASNVDIWTGSYSVNY
ncbi:keratinocyte proline-rich protein [Coccinella septempunctata]|uniref:keratinocyte proline-rich protein n=1 Tax=Coccinella septempunctata TaxID=41139 RepID=UPI001D0607B7|nr:keratinocyte proline-rich protein [Coccinella septempunctata]